MHPHGVFQRIISIFLLTLLFVGIIFRQTHTFHTYIHYITLHYITLHYITLHYITLHYITLHYITLHTYIYISIYHVIEFPWKLPFKSHGNRHFLINFPSSSKKRQKRHHRLQHLSQPFFGPLHIFGTDPGVDESIEGHHIGTWASRPLSPFGTRHRGLFNKNMGLAKSQRYRKMWISPAKKWDWTKSYGGLRQQDCVSVFVRIQKPHVFALIMSEWIGAGTEVRSGQVG